jgi:hypothetical protein
MVGTIHDFAHVGGAYALKLPAC